MLSLETGEREPLIQGDTFARYVPTGHLVYAQAGTPGTLLAAPFMERGPRPERDTQCPEHRDDGGWHRRSLSAQARNLNHPNAYEVFNRHSTLSIYTFNEGPHWDEGRDSGARKL